MRHLLESRVFLMEGFCWFLCLIISSLLLSPVLFKFVPTHLLFLFFKAFIFLEYIILVSSLSLSPAYWLPAVTQLLHSLIQRISGGVSGHSGPFLWCSLDSCCLCLHAFLLLLFSLSFKLLIVFIFLYFTLFFHLYISPLRQSPLKLWLTIYFLFLVLAMSSPSRPHWKLLSSCNFLRYIKGRSEFNGITMNY